MTKGISKKLQRNDLLRQKRMQAAELPQGAKNPPPAIPENSGATDDEIDFLLGEGDFEEYGSRRIELNALTSRQLVDLVERRLEQHGIKKIVPAADKLAGAFRAHARAPKIKEAIEKAIADMPDDAVEVPADLEEQVKAYLEENPECAWEEAVAEIVKSGEAA
jgi:hypothetical protein